jgi:hypothetical protein
MPMLQLCPRRPMMMEFKYHKTPRGGPEYRFPSFEVDYQTQAIGDAAVLWLQRNIKRHRLRDTEVISRRWATELHVFVACL